MSKTPPDAVKPSSSPRRLILLLALAAVCVPLVTGLTLWRLSRRAPPKPVGPIASLADARGALDAGRYDEARRLARLVEKSGRLTAGEQFWPSYILALATLHDCESIEGADRLEYDALAARYLREAAAHGFSPETRTNGVFLLGECLFHIGQEQESRPYLEEAVAAGGAQSVRAHWLLALVEASASPPRYPKALEHVRAYLANANLPHEKRNEALLEQADILYHLRDWDGALKVLDAHDPKHRSGEALLWRGRVLIEQAGELAKKSAPGAPLSNEARQTYTAAIAAFEGCQRRALDGEEAAASAAYLLAQCHVALGDAAAAQAQWERVRSRFPQSSESAAASWELAELHCRNGRSTEAIESFREFLATIELGADRDNHWLPWDAARRRLLTEIQRQIAAQHYDFALELAETCEPLLPAGQRWELAAQIESAWGRLLLLQAQQASAKDVEPLEVAARAHLARAGEAFRQLAQLHFTDREYGEYLWRAAEVLQEARDYRGAAHEFREYLSVELRNRRSQALLGLGEALVCDGKYSEALAVLDECIELDAAGVPSFAARILAADAHLEQGDVDKAEDCLEANLESEVLDPSSQEWRESLFALCRLLFDAGRYVPAILRLDEALARYPQAPAALEARYMLAEAYWKTAIAIDAEAAAESPEGSRQQDALEAALRNYEEVVTVFERRGYDAVPSAWEGRMLRNAYFGRGNVLFGLERYEKAIQAYLAIVNRYQGSPEVLEAYVQVFTCYQRLRQPEEARNALELARSTLAHLPASAAFTETTNFTPLEWSELLDSLGTL